VTLPSLILALACSKGDTAAPPADPLSWSVLERGPYNAGYRAWDVTYVDPNGDSRTIPLGVWYPTEDTEGEDVVWMGIFQGDDALGDAAAAPAVHPAGYPVLAYSHGYQGWGATSHDLMSFAASHGWVAVAPDHLGNTLLDTPESLPAIHYLHRPLDMQASLDALEALPADDPLAAADTSRVLMSGHSFGCYTSWAMAGAAYDADAVAARCAPEDLACEEAEASGLLSGALADPRVVATIPMAGGLDRSFFGDDGHTAVGGPFLFLTGTEDEVGLTEQFDTYTGVDRTWVEIEGGCHQAFALGGCSGIDTDVAYGIVDAYALAFGRAHVLGDTTAEVVDVVTGAVEVSPLARYTHADP
jgi:predicted dienelactone hydrolase